MDTGTIVICLSIGFIVGGMIGWVYSRAGLAFAIQSARNEAEAKKNEVERDLAACRAATEIQLSVHAKDLAGKQADIERLTAEIQESTKEKGKLASQLPVANANLEAMNMLIGAKEREINQLKAERDGFREQLSSLGQSLATEKANNQAFQDKLQTQKNEIEELGKRFNTEFENIANKILDTKTEKFTELNKTNLSAILEPLGKNITEFKTRVDEVYDKESKERFSLGEKVKELSELNQQISQEARNLTKALKGESKTQGRWGEMILESILERSGLVKGQEYFIEHELKDENGNALRSDAEGKKMRPDAVVHYPDNRHIIIDSKVSLNAFSRMVASDDADEQRAELLAHVNAVKNHVGSLSAKGYDDYHKALDFVMMFIPSEPAYNAALQGDPDLWNYAYDRRILLLSPTNLITSLKLVADLWKREYQNQNVQEIVERGAKLYDKFVSFVENLTDVGTHLDRANKRYADAYKQLSTGNDNLVLQATKLKKLGLKNKKVLPHSLVNLAEEELTALGDAGSDFESD